jgi:hypothetical protein
VEGKGDRKLSNNGVISSFFHYKGGSKGSGEITQQFGNFFILKVSSPLRNRITNLLGNFITPYRGKVGYPEPVPYLQG